MEKILSQVKNARCAEIEIVDLRCLFEGLSELVTANKVDGYLSKLHEWMLNTSKLKGNVDNTDIQALEFFSQLILLINGNKSVIEEAYFHTSAFIDNNGLA